MKIVTIGRDEEKPRKYVPLAEVKAKDKKEK